MQNEAVIASAAPEVHGVPNLRRVLGRMDLVLLFVVAVFNLNVVPSIAANGGVTVWLWIISLLLFFWPQGIAVIELAHRYPGEGGVYLWAKEVFGDFHGFLSGYFGTSMDAGKIQAVKRQSAFPILSAADAARQRVSFGQACASA